MFDPGILLVLSRNFAQIRILFTDINPITNNHWIRKSVFSGYFCKISLGEIASPLYFSMFRDKIFFDLVLLVGIFRISYLSDK